MIAGATAIILGTFSMVVFAAGNHRWDGAILFGFSGSHGIHRSDAFGVIPFAAGIVLAVWCVRHGRTK